MKTPKATNYLLFLWLCCYTGLTYAATTLYDDAKAYDWGSLWVAACAGMLGGFLQTILTLSSDKRVVLDILRDAWKDLAVALVGGMIVFICIQAVIALELMTIPRDVRILLIVGAGFSRGRWQWVISKLASDAVNRGRAVVRGDPPTSASAPLGRE